MTYSPEPWLQTYIDKKDIVSLPYALLTVLSRNDLPDEVALNTARWCKEQLPEVFQVTDENVPFPKEDKSKWTSDYYFRHTTYAESNFSMERFEYLVEIRNELRKQGHELFKRVEKSIAGNSDPNRMSEGERRKKPGLPTGVILLGALVVLVLILFMIVT